MRKRFEQQLIIGATPISETKFPLRSRDEDNVSLIDEELLFEINNLVVKHGQILLKKKEKEELELRLKTHSVKHLRPNYAQSSKKWHKKAMFFNPYNGMN